MPGVYWFLGADGNVLYVGKAKRLRRRVSSYTKLEHLPRRIREMVQLATAVRFRKLSSELEALLVEAELIRLYQPEYNTLLKDDKSPIYIEITKERFPRVRTLRKQRAGKVTLGTVFGPFPSSYKARQVLQIARTVFRWCNERGDKPVGKACFYYHLDLCSGACAGAVTEKAYREQIRNLKKFLRGKTAAVVSALQRELREHSDAQRYEQAAQLRDDISYIQYVTSPENHLRPDVELPGLYAEERLLALVELKRLLLPYVTLPADVATLRIEGYDISNIQGTSPVASLVTFVGGAQQKALYRLFNIRSQETPDDYRMMREALIRRQRHAEWGYPHLVILDGGVGQLYAGLSVWNWTSPMIAIAKDPDRLVIPAQRDEGSEDKPRTILIPLEKYPRVHAFVQKIRDESHRFAKKQHARLRTRRMLER